MLSEQDANQEAHIDFAFQFSAEVLRGDEVIDCVPEQHNLLLNQGLDKLCANGIQASIAYLHVGTSNATPTVGDTQLGAYLAGIQIGLGTTNPRWAYSAGSGTLGQPGYVPPSLTQTVTVTFAAGAFGASSVNIAELGLSSQQANGQLSTRALLTDASGNPTTLSVLPTDQLRVTYSVTVYQDMNTYVFSSVSLGEWTGDITVCAGLVSSSAQGLQDATNTNTLSAGQPAGKPFCTNTYGAAPLASALSLFYGSGSLGAVGTDPTGSSLGGASNSTLTSQAYVNGTYKNTAGFSLSVSQVPQNIYAVNFLVGGSAFSWKCGFSPAIPKSNLQTFNFNLTFTCGRYVQA